MVFVGCLSATIILVRIRSQLDEIGKAFESSKFADPFNVRSLLPSLHDDRLRTLTKFDRSFVTSYTT
jgi:hypothetical protein